MSCSVIGFIGFAIGDVVQRLAVPKFLARKSAGSRADGRPTFQESGQPLSTEPTWWRQRGKWLTRFLKHGPAIRARICRPMRREIGDHQRLNNITDGKADEANN